MADRTPLKQALPDLQYNIWSDRERGVWNWRVTAWKEGWPTRLNIDASYAYSIGEAMTAAMEAGRKWSRNESR